LLHSKLRLRPILNSPRRSWKHQWHWTFVTLADTNWQPTVSQVLSKEWGWGRGEAETNVIGYLSPWWASQPRSHSHRSPMALWELFPKYLQSKHKALKMIVSFLA
jgi:hypothetical protein